MAAVLVSVPLAAEKLPTTRPTHHLNDSASLFTNPWPSFRAAGRKELFNAIATYTRPPIPPQVTELIGSKSPDWGVSAGAKRHNLKATWLGHACFLVELPTPAGAARGARILFDPVFSHRCSPFSWLGPARFTPPPCSISQLPEVDVIVYSHNHYDHMDKPTIRELIPPSPSPPRIHIFAPLNNGPLFASLGIPPQNVHCLDWWHARNVSVALPRAKIDGNDVPKDGDMTAEKSPVNTSFRITCTPAQHFSGRGILDRHTTLWSSWVVESNPPAHPSPELDSQPHPAIESDTNQAPGSDPDTSSNMTLFFGGDTGYRTVRTGEDENEVPVCPAFKEIGARWGGFDLAFIPIGAYLPRAALSPVHCAPQDSVRLFQDIRARRGVAMHWGTWSLSYEPIMDPARLLKEECAKAGIADGVFGVCEIGETVVV